MRMWPITCEFECSDFRWSLTSNARNSNKNLDSTRSENIFFATLVYHGTVIKEFGYKGSILKRKYARFRIEVGLKEPLCPGFYLDLEEGDLIWIDFKYERIQSCSTCERIDHDPRECQEKDNVNTHTGEELCPNQILHQLPVNETSEVAAETPYRRTEEGEGSHGPTSHRNPMAQLTSNSPINVGTENKEPNNLTEVVIVQMESEQSNTGSKNPVRPSKVDPTAQEIGPCPL